MKKAPTKVFIAYSRADQNYLKQLRNHLSPLERTGHIEVWYDGKIQAGVEWDESIRQELAKAEIILLLLSADAIASAYFYEEEVKEALERHHRREARVIPFILRPCAWQTTPLGALQAIPKNGLPVINWVNHDDAYHDGVKHIQKLLEEQRGISISLPEPSPGVSEETEPEIPKPVSILGDLSAYSCNRTEIINRFWLGFHRNEAQLQPLQFFFLAEQQYGQADSMVRRLLINLKFELKKRKKVVKCSPKLKDIFINKVDISDRDKVDDCRDLLQLEFNRHIIPEVSSLQDFMKKIDTDFPAFSSAHYIPFAFKIKGASPASWRKTIRPALSWFVRDYCRLDESTDRRFLFFFIIEIEQEETQHIQDRGWLSSIFKKRNEPELPAFNLFQEFETFSEQNSIPATILPPLAMVRKEDLVEWFLPRTDDNERLAEERAEEVIELLRKRGEGPESQTWHMSDVEIVLKNIVDEERKKIHAI